MAMTLRTDAPQQPAPVAAWLDVLRQEDSSEREHAAELWSDLAEALPRAVSLLVSATNDPRQAVRAKALKALSTLGRQAQEIQSPIRTAVKRSSLWEEDESVRALAAEGLAQSGETARTPIADLIKALNDPEAPNRFSAAQALGERGQESLSAVGALLQKALNDPDGGVRLEAAVALYKIDRRVEKILPVLIKALRDPDEVRRWIAADSLGEIGPAARDAIPALRELLRGEFRSALLRRSVTLALEKIEGSHAAMPCRS
jgi:HEAT repeat protein